MWPPLTGQSARAARPSGAARTRPPARRCVTRYPPRTGKGNAALRSGAPGAGRAERAGRTGNGRKRAARGPLAPGPGQAETDSFIQALDVLDPYSKNCSARFFGRAWLAAFAGIAKGPLQKRRMKGRCHSGADFLPSPDKAATPCKCGGDIGSPPTSVRLQRFEWV